MYTSSYIINRKGMEKILSTWGNYLGVEPIDSYYGKIFDSTMWNVIPIPFDQDKIFETNIQLTNKFIEDIVSWIQIKKKLQKY